MSDYVFSLLLSPPFSGIYCLLTVATLLNILTPELLAGVPEFIASCQTYEGGFGSASFAEWAFAGECVRPLVRPCSTLTSSLIVPFMLCHNKTGGKLIDARAPRPSLGEAHGGYAFCATASWILLQPFIATHYTLTQTPVPSINTGSLLRWLALMQGSHVELGGFRGRTNKLVDGCYSWWVGGCFVLVEGLLQIERGAEEQAAKTQEETDEHKRDDGEWADVDGASAYHPPFVSD